MSKKRKLSNIEIPPYSDNEEKWNMLSHIVGAVVSAILGCFCILKSVFYYTALEVTAISIFVASTMIVYTISSIYHALHKSSGKKVLRVIDHCAIYIMIAGTYTPFLLCGLFDINKEKSIILLSFVWAFAILATVFSAIDLEKYKVFNMICYIAIGWSIIFVAKDMLTVLTLPGFIYLFGGGVVYTIGAIFYGIGGVKKVKYAHFVFHLFIIGGSILQTISILYYIL